MSRSHWHINDVPPVLETLEQPLREHAIEVANELFAKGYGEIRAMSMGIARALEWDEAGRPDPEATTIGPVRYVHPGPDRRWVITDNTDDGEALIYPTFEAALARASELAKEDRAPFYVFTAEGKLVGKYEMYCERETAKSYVRVGPTGEGWAVQSISPGGKLETFSTKKEAVSRGREVSREAARDLLVLYQTGDLQKVVARESA